MDEGSTAYLNALDDEPRLLHDRAIIEDGVTVAGGVEVGPGAFVGAGVRLDQASIVGPNATVLSGVRVGVGAEVTAGAVVTSDVPPYAIARGNPAQIVGYRSTAPHGAEHRIRASSIEEDDFPLTLAGITLARHPVVKDLRGSLSFGEIGNELPFTPVRYFLIYGVPGPQVRGEHSHRELHELLVCVHGEMTVMANNGTERAEVVLDRPDVSLHLPPMIWAAQFRYSADAVLMVLCSQVYEADDYIRDYDEFEALLGGG